MTKFEMMMTILFSIHIFVEMAIFGVINEYVKGGRQ